MYHFSDNKGLKFENVCDRGDNLVIYATDMPK